MIPLMGLASEAPVGPPMPTVKVLYTTDTLAVVQVDLDKWGWVLLGIGADSALATQTRILPGNDTGNVISPPSVEGWIGILYTFDIFEGGWVLADAHLTIFWRSVWLSLCTTALTFAVGFPTAWFIATRPPATRGVWLFLITIPYWVNLLIRTVSLKFLIRDNGPLNESLMSLGLISDPLPLVNTNLAVQLGLFYSYLPFMVLPLYAVLEKQDQSQLEAAADLGEQPRREPVAKQGTDVLGGRQQHLVRRQGTRWIRHGHPLDSLDGTLGRIGQGIRHGSLTQSANYYTPYQMGRQATRGLINT